MLATNPGNDFQLMKIENQGSKQNKQWQPSAELIFKLKW